MRLGGDVKRQDPAGDISASFPAPAHFLHFASTCVEKLQVHMSEKECIFLGAVSAFARPRRLRGSRDVLLKKKLVDYEKQMAEVFYCAGAARSPASHIFSLPPPVVREIVLRATLWIVKAQNLMKSKNKFEK